MPFLMFFPFQPFHALSLLCWQTFTHMLSSHFTEPMGEMPVKKAHCFPLVLPVLTHNFPRNHWAGVLHVVLTALTKGVTYSHTSCAALSVSLCGLLACICFITFLKGGLFKFVFVQHLDERSSRTCLGCQWDTAAQIHSNRI